MVIAEPRQIWGVPWSDEQGCGRVLLFLVRRRNSGIFPPHFQNRFSRISRKILGATELVDATALASFIGTCQFRFGGIAKAPREHPGRFLASPCRCMTEKTIF